MITPYHIQLLKDLINEEQATMRESRKYVVDADLIEWDNRYEAYSTIIEELQMRSQSTGMKVG